jgi:hypothetical protein
LDEFRCHKQPSFLSNVAALGTYVDIIPGGYTSVLQVVDVGINKSFKGHFRELYMEWLMSNFDVRNFDSLAQTSLPSPSREHVAKWIVASWSRIEMNSIIQTWKHIGYFEPLVIGT